jgi:hypothetical protein
MKLIDLTGRKFERLTVLSYAGKSANKHSQWLCRCDCGKERTVLALNLKRGFTKSCGCFHSDNMRRKKTTHNDSYSPEHRAWSKAKSRCFNPKDKAFCNYGGRGITMCDRWKNSYENFIADMGRRLDGFSLDRIDVNGNYEPSNCRWADKITQANNTRTNRFLTHKGKTQTASEWAREIGVKRTIIHGRIFHGWSVERMLEQPVGVRI